MSREIRQLQTWNIDTNVIKRFRVYDLLGSTAFLITSATWALNKKSDGVELLSGSAVVNNSDEDRAGNEIKTISMTIDLRETDDHDRGSYYLVIDTRLNSEQTDRFRIPVRLVDYRKKGAV